MKSIFIGVGSNLGDREKNIQTAGSLMEGRGIRVMRMSPIYETEALCRFENKVAAGSDRIDSVRSCQAGGSGEKLAKPSPDKKKMPSFLNAVFEIESELSPADLLTRLESIEGEMGREGKGDWKPRPIDLDILFYGDRVMESPRLRIPHPEIANRWFVLKPLSDLAPDWMHPISKKTIKELLCNSSSTQPT